ncbi:hypothetical protein N7489_000650 [Penicillium chrysogenum]|uniref:F-box domain-containing protein n=1 Tax=Penicillium chrysogenum TaxID=5076 RepID=A0ABQ8WHQ3_PENCH|nr:uncharacterized protein N7489_000650 [Penicillium chrysogenum]KAJ5250240.1 hypothetical protein N7489_000650 [Penicillium chrysogenum]KAJ5265854.1 hypothetical protein N7524_006872 [Penicillium chrysogenum]KAJ5269145.1 hypothetical protein N7505_004903 [Penicillium chrysogenum]KAJ6148143.1 hypothetical protein N7497_010125 [Penicillium chrysogenum]
MVSLLDLPAEIRLIIYTYLLKPNEYVKSYQKLRDPWSSASSGPLCTIPRPYVKRYTPSILLLNKKITIEALHYLYRIPLDLYGTPITYFVMRQMDITEFISEHYLRRIHHGVLRLNHANKHFVLSLLDTWGAENRLERLDVYRPKTQLDSRHWKVVESRLWTFSSIVPVVFHEVDDPLKARASRAT